MRWTQIFEYFEQSDNILIINVLQLNSPFLSPNHIRNPPTFQFLFRRAFKTINYTFLNNLTGFCCLFFRFSVFFYFQRAVVKFSAHSERISTALQIKLQCAMKKKTVR